MRCRLHIALLLAASAVAAAEQPVIGLVTDFPAGTPASLQQEVRLETERALQVAGVELAWRALSGAGPVGTFDRLVILRFRGSCTPSRNPNRKMPLALGFTHVSDGHMLPFVEINCERVLEAMERGAWPGRFRQSEAAVGRAVGRVAAHEIYHVLTGSSLHDNEGLMKASFDWRDLCGSDLSFSGESSRRLRFSVGTAAAQTSARVKGAGDD